MSNIFIKSGQNVLAFSPGSDDAKDVEAMRRAQRQKERDLEARKAEVPYSSCTVLFVLTSVRGEPQI